MANVFLLSTAPEDSEGNSWPRGGYIRLKQSAEAGRTVHRLVADPAEADLILFAELNPPRFALDVRRHPYVRRFREKCFLFDQSDTVIPFLPGVYASIEKRWYSPSRVRSGFYLTILENAFVEYDLAPVTRDLLYSFIGSVDTAPVRAVLARLVHPRSLFLDTSRESLPLWYSGTPEERAAFWKRYADGTRRSQFILCPRGRGVSSLRLFETMKMGRAPVIISDQWVPPEGPAWERCSLRVAERDVPHLPRILEEREAEAVEMGILARREWERWFSPDATFNTVVDWCLEIKKARRRPESWARLAAYRQLTQPHYFREYLRTWALIRFLKQRFGRASRAENS